MNIRLKLIVAVMATCLNSAGLCKEEKSTYNLRNLFGIQDAFMNVNNKLILETPEHIKKELIEIVEKKNALLVERQKLTKAYDELQKIDTRLLKAAENAGKNIQENGDKNNAVFQQKAGEVIQETSNFAHTAATAAHAGTASNLLWNEINIIGKDLEYVGFKAFPYLPQAAIVGSALWLTKALNFSNAFTTAAVGLFAWGTYKTFQEEKLKPFTHTHSLFRRFKP